MPKEVALECVCGKPFSIENACPVTEVAFQHCDNKIENITASLLTKVCSNVAAEPAIPELSKETLSGGSANRENNARVDIAADGFWGPGMERAFTDIHVLFNPFTLSDRKNSI